MQRLFIRPAAGIRLDGHPVSDLKENEPVAILPSPGCRGLVLLRRLTCLLDFAMVVSERPHYTDGAMNVGDGASCRKCQKGTCGDAVCTCLIFHLMYMLDNYMKEVCRLQIISS